MNYDLGGGNWNLFIGVFNLQLVWLLGGSVQLFWRRLESTAKCDLYIVNYELFTVNFGPVTWISEQ